MKIRHFQGVTVAVGQGFMAGCDIGEPVILPSSHTGGRRCLQENFQAALAISRVYGPPDLVSTFACDPNWPEITEALLHEPGQRSSDRPDIVLRVYTIKLNEHLADIKSGRACGSIEAVVHTVEFQKRDSPHAHIHIWQKRSFDAEIALPVSPAASPTYCPPLLAVDLDLPAQLNAPYNNTREASDLAVTVRVPTQELYGQQAPAPSALTSNNLQNLAQMDCIPISALRVGHSAQHVRVRASRVYHYRNGLQSAAGKDLHMVLIDEKGDSVYAVVPDRLVSKFIHDLHETAVYELGQFEVSSKEKLMNPVENGMVIIFTPLTTIYLVLQPDDTFPEWTFRLTSFADLRETPRKFVDIIGVIRGISNVAALNLHGRSVPVNRRHISLADASGNEIRITLWDEAALQFNGQALRVLAREESAVVIFVGATVHTYEGNKELAGGDGCRWYINVDIENINILRASVQSSFQPIAQLPAPRHLNLQTPNSARYPTKTLSELLHLAGGQNQAAMIHCRATVWRLTPGSPWWFAACGQCGSAATPAASSAILTDRYMCSAIGCACPYASLEYRLHLLVSDDTGQAEFTLMTTVAKHIIPSSPQQTVLNNYQGVLPVTNLAVAAAQICHTPPELAAVMSRKYKFLLHVTPDSFQGNWASFTVQSCDSTG